jgi:hypothetical protein
MSTNSVSVHAIPPLDPCFEGKPREFLLTLVGRAARHGQTTLEEAAHEQGISVKTAWDYMLEAARVSIARRIALPFVAKWDEKQDCSLYSLLPTPDLS